MGLTILRTSLPLGTIIFSFLAQIFKPTNIKRKTANLRIVELPFQTEIQCIPATECTLAPGRLHGAWLGGSMLAQSPGFDGWISQEKYWQMRIEYQRHRGTF